MEENLILNIPFQCKRMPLYPKHISQNYNGFLFFSNLPKIYFQTGINSNCPSCWATYNYQLFMHCAIIGCRRLTKWIHAHKETSLILGLRYPLFSPKLSLCSFTSLHDEVQSKSHLGRPTKQLTFIDFGHLDFFNGSQCVDYLLVLVY